MVCDARACRLLWCKGLEPQFQPLPNPVLPSLSWPVCSCMGHLTCASYVPWHPYPYPCQPQLFEYLSLLRTEVLPGRSAASSPLFVPPVPPVQVANMADEHTDYMLTAHHNAVSACVAACGAKEAQASQAFVCPCYGLSFYSGT